MPDEETTPRSLRTRSIGDLAADAMRLATGGAHDGWTDAQWADHDARVLASRAADAALLEQAERDRRPRQLLGVGWPKLALEIAQQADTTQKAIAHIAAWKPPGIFVLLGPKGCGKTVAAAWWALQRREPTAFVRASTFAASSRYERDDRDELLRSSALVLDDLGTEYADIKGSFLVDLDELIDKFYGDRRTLIITTNAKPDEITKRFGERIADRLREVGTIIAVNGISLRGKP